MPVNDNATLEITAFKWVPDFAQGFVRDLRPRWACEEIGLDYSERLLGLERPDSYYREQPWGQVPVINDGGIEMFESGAILLHIAEKDERLMRRDPQSRASTISWLFAAFNSIEPLFFELGNVDLFAKGEQWAELRRPSLIEFLGQRLDRLSDALGDRQWLLDDFSVADIAMVTVLREGAQDEVITSRPTLAAYVGRGVARPAFERAMAAQLAPFAENEPAAA
jgi:glutathione S-transferase